MLEAVDFVASNLLFPISAFLVALFVGWSWPAVQARANADLTDSPVGGIWLTLVRDLTPLAILLILFQGLSLI